MDSALKNGVLAGHLVLNGLRLPAEPGGELLDGQIFFGFRFHRCSAFVFIDQLKLFISFRVRVELQIFQQRSEIQWPFYCVGKQQFRSTILGALRECAKSTPTAV